ncbi:unnamed protein product [Allacma fusca]|uniref:Peptidase S1 domain-containing protein n=1 Tax=Allacma fusca TaxID=39272 RepID=A0A8J2JIC2_9HEXA|nr:unnamed protein product [Allacma fusca]
MVFHLLFLLSLLTDKADPEPVKPQIIGGEDARPGEFPWMILIQYFSNDEWERGCGGAIIDHRHIITAAHCWLRKSLPHRVVVGAHNISDENEPSRQIHVPCRFHQHPMWN